MEPNILTEYHVNTTSFSKKLCERNRNIVIGLSAKTGTEHFLNEV